MKNRVPSERLALRDSAVRCEFSVTFILCTNPQNKDKNTIKRKKRERKEKEKRKECEDEFCI
jgi:hypothetical protein